MIIRSVGLENQHNQSIQLITIILARRWIALLTFVIPLRACSGHYLERVSLRSSVMSRWLKPRTFGTGEPLGEPKQMQRGGGGGGRGRR